MKKILLSIITFAALIIVANVVNATTISVSPTNPKVGDTVTITVTVPNVHTASVTANISGAVNGTIKVVNGDMNGNVSTFSNSASFHCDKAGTINIAISGDSSAVLNGQYVDVGASTSVNVEEVAPTPEPEPDPEPTPDPEPNENQNPQTPTKPTTDTTNKKSNNANLSNLGITPNDFTGFKPNITEYATTVPNDVTSINLYAIGIKGQTIKGTGTKELQEGDNNFEVVVTAEDGTTQKTYKLKVTRETATEENPEETPPEEGATEASEGFGLSELKIAGVELSPRFSTEVYEYTAKYTGDSDKLDITTTPTEEGTNVEITGNENLSDGENLITILVTDSSGDKTAAYQITVQKQTIDEEAIAKQEEIERQQQIRNYIIIGGAVLLVLVLIIILIIRHRRNMRYIQEYSMPYSEEDDDEYYDDNVNDDEDYEKITKKFLKNDKSSIDNEYEDKENAKNSYLNQFEDDSEYDDESMQRKRHNKGKRFK